MLHLLQVNEQGHIPNGKKRAFILTNETRLLAFIWIMLRNMTDLKLQVNVPRTIGILRDGMKFRLLNIIFKTDGYKTESVEYSITVLRAVCRLNDLAAN